MPVSAATPLWDDMNVTCQSLTLVSLRLPKRPLRLTVQSWQAANPVHRFLFGARNVQRGYLIVRPIITIPPGSVQLHGSPAGPKP